MTRRKPAQRSAFKAGRAEGSGRLSLLLATEARQRAFIANLSHEFLTPITSIKGFAQTLAAGSVERPKMRLKWTKIIERNADRLTKLIEDLLQLNSYSEDSSRPPMEGVPLRAIVCEQVKQMASRAADRGVSFHLSISENLKVFVNAAELGIVMHNLLENAVKFNRRNGTVRIHARVARKRAVVSVADSGIGVPKDQLPFIFDWFHREDNAGLAPDRGNGLGLSIARAILLDRACPLWAESVEGKGTRIRFTLPLPQ